MLNNNELVITQWSLYRGICHSKSASVFECYHDHSLSLGLFNLCWFVGTPFMVKSASTDKLFPDKKKEGEETRERAREKQLHGIALLHCWNPSGKPPQPCHEPGTECAQGLWMYFLLSPFLSGSCLSREQAHCKHWLQNKSQPKKKKIVWQPRADKRDDMGKSQCYSPPTPKPNMNIFCKAQRSLCPLL